MVNAALILGPAIRPACTHLTVALTNNSIVSDLDTAEGNWEPVVQRLDQNVPTTIPQMELAFNIHIAPLGSAVATRTKHWRSWRTVLTSPGPPADTWSRLPGQ